MNEAEQFFYDNAGYSYDPKTETKVEGRRRCAAALAAAERRLKDGPFFIDYEPDNEPWDGDVPYDGPIWYVGLYSVEGATDSRLLGGMGMVACEEGDPYMRVVAAELALEWIPKNEQ